MKRLTPTSLRVALLSSKAYNTPAPSKNAYICARCLSSSSQRSASSIYPPSKSFAHLPARRLISLTGPDASHFLQGVVTQNVSPKTPRSAPGFYAAFLNAQGRVINDVFIYQNQSDTGLLVEVDAAEAEKLFKHIKRYKLRSKLNVRLLDIGEMDVWSVWDEGEAKEWKAHGLGGNAASSSSSTPNPYGVDGGILLPDTRAPGMGHRLIAPASKIPNVDAEQSTEKEYTIRRYLKGVPEGQGEILREAALPQESNIDYMGGIDYRKGCYVGQELTIRTHHTGVVRKRILPVVVYGDGEEIPTAQSYQADGSMDGAFITAESSLKPVAKRGRSAGKWLAGVGNVGLALCRLEMMTDVVLGGEGSGSGYKDGDEFKIEWEDGGKTAKVKAFVPGWHLNR